MDIKNHLVEWVESYFYSPNLFQKLISFLLLPLTLFYCIIVLSKRIISSSKNFDIDIISIGNLLIGGTGKTPVTIALAKNRSKVTIILRGYGRSSKGMFVVSEFGEIKVDVATSGDEAMLIASSLPNASVIVSENREIAIEKAKELGSRTIILDDGFSKAHILKKDILLKPKYEPTNIFCLPSGPYREPYFLYGEADYILQEDIDFKREVKFFKNGHELTTLPHKLVLVSSIARAKRLFEFLPSNIPYKFFEDHHNFTEDEIKIISNQYKEHTIITTEKDFVKLNKMPYEFIIMSLEIEFLTHEKSFYL
jgi:tetraacyldisaccharide 4'-kinase